MLVSRHASSVVAGTAAAAALMLVPGTGTAAPITHAAGQLAPTKTVTDFGLQAAAFGTRVRGGTIPANSGRTALAYLGCTRLAGLDRANSLASVNLGGATADGIRSKARTFRKNGALHSKAINTIASLNVSGSSTPAPDDIRIKGIRTVADVWHNKSGFHRRTTTRIGSLTVGGLNIPLAQFHKGDTFNVPGVATLTFFVSSGKTTAHSATARARTLKIAVDATGSTILAGNANAKIHDGLVAGVLGGQGRALDGSVLNGTARTGKIAVQPLPCQGTNGKWITNKTLGVTLNGVVHTGALTASARGDQIDRTHAYGQTRGRVARATLGTNNNLVVKGVVAAANVRKNGAKLVKTAKGTRIASITYRGNDLRIPTVGHPVRVKGLAVLSAPRVDKTRYGITVVALRVKLLNGTAAVFNLGRARVSLSPR